MLHRKDVFIHCFAWQIWKHFGRFLGVAMAEMGQKGTISFVRHPAEVVGVLLSQKKPLGLSNFGLTMTSGKRIIIQRLPNKFPSNPKVHSLISHHSKHLHPAAVSNISPQVSLQQQKITNIFSEIS